MRASLDGVSRAIEPKASRFQYQQQIMQIVKSISKKQQDDPQYKRDSIRRNKNNPNSQSQASDPLLLSFEHQRKFQQRGSTDQNNIRYVIGSEYVFEEGKADIHRKDQSIS